MCKPSSVALLLCSLLCIRAAYQENVKLGAATFCLLLLSWLWSRNMFLATFRHKQQERRLESRINHKAKRGGGSVGRKRTKEEGM